MEGKARCDLGFRGSSFLVTPQATPTPVTQTELVTPGSEGFLPKKAFPAVAEQGFCCGVPCAPQFCSQVFVLSGAAHADGELTSGLTEKISLLEQKIEKQAQEIQLKVKASLLLSLLCVLSDLVWAPKFICALLLITQTSPLHSNRAVGSGLGVAEGTVPAGTSCSSGSQQPGTQISSSLASGIYFCF